MSIRGRVRRLIVRSWGPAGSLLLHLLIIFALVQFVVFERRQPDDDYIEITFVDPLVPDIEPPPEIRPVDDLPVAPIDVPLVTDDPLRPEDILPPDITITTPQPLEDLRPWPNESPMVIRDLFSDQRTPENRALALQQHLTRSQAELTSRAVLNALRWLKDNQLADGSWDHGSGAPTAMTGLALLSFLAHGETTASPEFGQTVERAIRYVVRQQQADGRFHGVRDHAMDGGRQYGVYGHGIAAYALSEAYGMTKIPDLKPAMDKAIQVIIDGQQAGGGWDYGYRKDQRRDTSITAFNVQALKAAQLAGSSARGIRDAMDRAIRDLGGAFNQERGEFGYTASHVRNEGMTPLAVLCYQLLGRVQRPEPRAALTRMREARCNWTDPGQWALYRWYYTTQALFQHGDRNWNSWKNQFTAEYVRHQNDDGSWTAPGAAHAYASGREVNYGPVYSTTFAALTLQVFYRMLPTYEHVEPQGDKLEPSSDDVVIEII